MTDNRLGPLIQADHALIYLQTGKLPAEDEEQGEGNGCEYGGNDTSSGVGNGDSNSDADYSDIFRQIAEHQKAIFDLIQQLPEKERRKVQP